MQTFIFTQASIMMSRAELKLRNYFLKSLLNYATTADNYGEKRKNGKDENCGCVISRSES